ncbi:MAG: hypothetical protein ACI8P3_002229 [Saprospiraceae bacterium]|jgi:hypothetical protein
MKKNNNRLLLIRNAGLFLMLLTFISCDPAQTIQFANQTDDAATVMIVFKKGDHVYKFVEPTESDTLIIDLEPKGQNAVRTFHFGLGTWKIQNSVDSLIAAVELIEIKTAKSKETYQGEQQIRTFIKDRIAGSFKELIEIKLK